MVAVIPGEVPLAAARQAQHTPSAANGGLTARQSGCNQVRAAPGSAARLLLQNLKRAPMLAVCLV